MLLYPLCNNIFNKSFYHISVRFRNFCHYNIQYKIGNFFNSLFFYFWRNFIPNRFYPLFNCLYIRKFKCCIRSNMLLHPLINNIFNIALCHISIRFRYFCHNNVQDKIGDFINSLYFNWWRDVIPNRFYPLFNCLYIRNFYCYIWIILLLLSNPIIYNFLNIAIYYLLIL